MHALNATPAVSLLILTSLCLSACVAPVTLDRSAPPPTNVEAVLVLGVTHPDYKMVLFPGVVKDGRFHQDKLRAAPVYAFATDGYVVAKVKPGETLAITQVSYIQNHATEVGKHFVVCGESKTLVLRPRAGRISYFATMAYSMQGEELSVRYRDDLDDAKAFVESAFGRFPPSSIEKGEFELLSTDRSCQPLDRIVLPVFIGR